MEYYTDSCGKGKDGEAICKKFLESEGWQVELITNERQQAECGDAWVTRPDGSEGHYVEFKTEEKARPNVFLELWSNADFLNGRTKLGWAMRLQPGSCKRIIYYFLDTKRLHSMSYPRLLHLAFREQLDMPRRFRTQDKVVQKNIPIAIIVPFERIKAFDPDYLECEFDGRESGEAATPSVLPFPDQKRPRPGAVRA